MLPDLLAYDLALVICGTAVGETSARVREYYAKPGNKLWRTLYEVGLTSRLLAPAEYRELLEERIGLTDLVKDKFGMDKDLIDSDFGSGELLAKMNKYQPEILCFNGKRAGKEFLMRKVVCGLQAETIGRTKIYVAPSTSGAANRWWDIKKWEELARLVKRAR